MADIPDSELLRELADWEAVLVPKVESPLARVIGFFWSDFLWRYWTTWRLPFQWHVRVGYPAGVLRPELCLATIRHELHHVRLLSRWWGPWVAGALALLLPLPVFFSGRWFLERWAYLEEIRAGRRTVTDVVDLLWYGYGWAWPPSLMRRWFQTQLRRSGHDTHCPECHRRM